MNLLIGSILLVGIAQRKRIFQSCCTPIFEEFIPMSSLRWTRTRTWHIGVLKTQNELPNWVHSFGWKCAKKKNLSKLLHTHFGLNLNTIINTNYVICNQSFCNLRLTSSCLSLDWSFLLL